MDKTIEQAALEQIGTYDCKTCPPHYKVAAEFAQTENTRLCLLLADIRSALGDPEGKMMQEDFVQHCKEVVEWLNKLDFADWKGGAIKNRGEYGFALYDLGGCIVEHYKTPLEALTAYLKGKE